MLSDAPQVHASPTWSFLADVACQRGTYIFLLLIPHVYFSPLKIDLPLSFLSFLLLPSLLLQKVTQLLELHRRHPWCMPCTANSKSPEAAAQQLASAGIAKWGHTTRQRALQGHPWQSQFPFFTIPQLNRQIKNEIKTHPPPASTFSKFQTSC